MKFIIHIFRLMRAGHIVAKHRIIPQIVVDDLPMVARFALFMLAPFGINKLKNDDRRIALALTKLGPTYIKLGQFLATRPDLVGVLLADNLTQLQDDVAPFGHDIAVKILEKNFNQKLNVIFADFSQPIAAASIAQVHKATLKNGDVVAVKILRPNIAKAFKKDLSDFLFVAKLAEKASPEARRLRLVEVVNTLDKAFNLELNLTMEAAAISEMASQIEAANIEAFATPSVYWPYTNKNILTTSWIEAAPLSNMVKIDTLGLDKPKLAVNIINSFLTQALEFGFFHADMHPGNIFIKPDGQIVLVDFGIMDRMSKNERRFLAEILYGFVTRDYLHIAKVHFEAGYVPNHHRVEDFGLALRAIGETLLGKPADEISMGGLLRQLLKTTEDFDMQTQLQLVMLQKSLVIIEGVARIIDPKFDMFKAIEPTLEAWLKTTLGAEAKVKDSLETIAELAGHLSKIPQYIDRAMLSIEQLEKIASSDAIMADAAKTTKRHARFQTGLLLVAVSTFIYVIV